MQSVMIGTPSVSTSIGVEGLDLEDGLHVLVADDPSRFASSITRLIEDDDLWRKLAVQGRHQIIAAHGREAVAARFTCVISEVMNKPIKQSITVLK